MKKLLLTLFVCSMGSIVLWCLPIEKENVEGMTVEPVPIVINEEVKEEIVIEEVNPFDVAYEKIQKEMAIIKSIEDKKEWFIAYKDIVHKYAKWFDPPETVFDVFSEEEVKLICRVVETECYQQDFESKCNVANVIFNRYESDQFGETIEEIITAENQFAYGRDIITEDTILSVMYSFEIEDTTNGALFFHSNEKTDTFNGADYIFSDSCGHNFYGY